MKTFKITAGCLVLFCFLILNANGQSSREIIEKHIEAIGGESNWNKVNTIVIEGKLQTEDALIKLKKSIIKNKSSRTDMSIQSRMAIVGDKKYYIILQGDQGWKYMPDTKGTILALYPGEIAELKDQMDYEDPFLHYGEKGREIEMIGIEYYDSTEYYKFRIVYPTGKTYFCYINTKTYLIAKMVLVDADYEDIREYSNYEQLPQGILMAQTIMQLNGEYTISSIKINPVLPQELFKPNDLNKVNFR